MKKMKGLYVVLAAMVFAGCAQKTVVEQGLPSIGLEVSKDILPVSSFIKKVDYVELKLSEAGVEMGEVEKVKEIGNDFLIKHRHSGKSSFMRFSKNGDFIVEIAGDKQSKIKEPIDIITYEKGYAVLAKNGIHLLAKDGKYLEQADRSQISGSAFFSSNNQFWVVNNVDPQQIVTAYPKAAKAKTPPAEKNERLARLLDAGVQEFGRGTIHVYSLLNDTVFSFQDGSLSPAYVLDGEGTPSFSTVWTEAKKLDDNNALRLIQDSVHVTLKNLLENDRYIFLSYWVGSAATTALFTKATGETRYFAHGVNDIDGGIWDKVFCLTDRDELLIPITAYKVSGHKISNKKVKGFDELQTRLATTGNPVLMRCQLR